MRLMLSLLGIDEIFDRIRARFGDELHPRYSESDEPDAPEVKPAPAVPAPPDVSYLREHFGDAIKSFYASIDRITADNPVDMADFMPLAAKARSGGLTPDETARFAELKLAAQRQGRAVGAVLGFFLKFRPYPMLAEIRAKEAVFQPAFGP